MSSTYTHITQSLLSDEQTDIPNSVLFPIQVPIELPRIVSSIGAPQVGVRTNFVQKEPLDLQCRSMILVIYVVEDVSIYLDIVDF